jgi:hypothetical protein
MIFNAKSLDPAVIDEAARLARRAAITWFVGWLLPAAALILAFGSQSGEMAALGASFILATALLFGTTASVISFRLATKARRLDRGSRLAKAVVFLNVVSLLWALIVGGLTLSDYVG